MKKGTRIQERLRIIRERKSKLALGQDTPTTTTATSRHAGRLNYLLGQPKAVLKPNQATTLWTPLVFMRTTKRRVGRTIDVSRIPTTIYGLFNQLFALFAAVDITRTLGRNLLFVGDFYVNFGMSQHFVPLSKVLQLGSLLTPTMDWDKARPEPTQSRCFRSIENLQEERRIQDLEIGCCFMFPLPNHAREEHIRQMRFHPIFYRIVSSFLIDHPKYQVVHYRMENDFTGHFFRGMLFETLEECRLNLFNVYQETMKNILDPEVPTLVVSHYYKDPQQPRDHDLQWKNLIHFTLTPQQRSELCQHLGLPISAPMREVDALIDFILCTTPNVSSFIGCGGSTFSGSVCLFHDNKKCLMIHPNKN